MNKELYEKYINYFLNKFKDDRKLKFDIVRNNDDMCGVYIYSNSDFSEYFLRVDNRMIYIDGIVVQNEGIEYSDITKIDSKQIYEFLDKQGEELLNFLKNGLILYAYKHDDNVVTMSTSVTNRAELFKDFNIISITLTNIEYITQNGTYSHFQKFLLQVK